MSETEHHRGELLLITFEGSPTFKEKLEVLEKSYDIDDFEPSGVWASENLVFFENNFYSIEREDVNADDDIITATRYNSEVIKFETRFYNGGACFSECLESALKGLK